jgi:outer membrane protein
MDWAPTANLNVEGQRRFGRSFSEQEGQIIQQSIDELFGGVNGGITLRGMGLHNWSSMQQAASQSTASELSLGRTRQDVVFQVMNRYITLVENREVLVVQREELEARRQQLRQIREFVNAGSRPVSALYEQQAAVAEAESNVLGAERDVQLSETRLIQTLRLNPMDAYAFEAPPLARDTLIGQTYDMRQLMQRAFDRRLDLRSARADVRAAERGVSVARSQYYPTLSLRGNYNSSWSSTIPDIQAIPNTAPEQTFQVETLEGEVLEFTQQTGPPEFRTSDFLNKLDQRRGGSVSLGLSFPIFDGLRREQQIEQAQVAEQNAQYDLEDQRLQIALEVREAYLNYQTATKQLEVTAKRLRAARQAREAAQERYNLGAASIVELTNANRTFVQAASQRVRARYSFLFQQKLIDYYVGVLEPESTLFEPTAP